MKGKKDTAIKIEEKLSDWLPPVFLMEAGMESDLSQPGIQLHSLFH
jgi:hypothetical protein